MAGSNSDDDKKNTINNTEKSTNSSIPTFTEELQLFDFKDEAIDTALRKLLAKVHLPKEAQQIDRAMEDFAKHYHQCNPLLTNSPDPIYAVAFSILLLHTDAHNKNVKRKMNKDTFIMRTKYIEGGETVYSEVLDIMYDNIVCSEFTYVHEQQDKSSSWFSKKSSQPNNALVHDLYSKLEQLMPANNTFKYKSTPKSIIDISNIHASIEQAQSLQLAGVRSRHSQSDGNETYMARVCKAGVIERKYDLAHGGKRAPARGWRPFGMILSGNQIMFFGDLTTFQSWLDRTQDEQQIRQLQQQQQQQYGNLQSPTSSKHPIQHQSSYSSTVSTPTTVNSLSTISSSQSSVSNIPIIPSSTTSLASPRSSTSVISTSTSSSTLHLRPVQIVSLLDAVCLYDEAYQKYPHVFRLIAGDGQQFLIRGESAEDIDDWIQKINYASAMKTTGVRLRPKTTTTTTTTQLPNTHYHRHYHHLDGHSFQHWAKREAKAKQRVISLSEQLVEQNRQLAKDEQLRNQMMVLTPMQKTTKDRMILFGDTIGKRLLQQRITIQKLECYREYIERELFLYQSFKDQTIGFNDGSSNSNNIGRKLSNGKNTIARKLSAPLPFYSGLLQVRSATAPPMQNVSTSGPLLRPPLLGLSMTSTTTQGNDDKTTDIRIPHRSSSLLVSLSGVDTTSSATETTTGRNNEDSQPISQVESTTKEQRLSNLPPILTDQQEPFFTSDEMPISSISNDDAIYHSRLSEMDRISRQRSQSNPVSPVQGIGKEEESDSEVYLSSLQVPRNKKNRDRSMSEVTTDDEDFSLVAIHGDQDSLVNHVDRVVDDI
ncbi:uncharacterized protein BX664DRAFT_384473 [Halteromyces radiatus]|uniref:uncharacterized protein n=1 Tax=Halteromyces radiatus TaxID=101107 RepID=UPI002220D419|nr:uncharacterized protein BX664DRAFT_384473 [Halteromyces radiatus]KAI8092980.1 hypothetical protein BX664DRAFT_384473 [Halteromyces radiatus]